MCGIVGFFDKSIVDKKPVINDMMDAIKHRGPNSSGEFIDDKTGMALGFRRLSIIDIKSGMQPILNEDGTKAIIFNGEIFNFQGIREDLIKAGHVFKTHADTEVLLHGYEEYGIEGLLKKVRGMFAFAIMDTVSGELVGARDFFGIKPFYYYQDGDTFMFGSEIKSFLKHPNFKKELNKKAIKPYMTLQYPALDETFFKGVYRIPEGHYFRFKDGKLDIKKYWDMEFKENNLSLEETINKIDETMQESVKTHTVSDVPVGALLSSGVDSSYVTALLKPQKTFSIGFDDKKYHEGVAAKELADKLGLDNTSDVVSAQDAFDYFPLIQYYMDEPDSNPSCVPLFFLTKLAAKDVTVILSGEGADELFAGYANYGNHSHSKAVRKIAEGLKKLPTPMKHGIGSLIGKLPYFPGQTHLYESTADPIDFFIGEAKVFDEDESQQLLKPDYQDSTSVKDIMMESYKKVRDLDDVKQMQYVDLHQFMAKDINLKADKMSMANSVELRVPFLDREVADVAREIPTKYLLNDKDSKYALRMAANKHLPEEWATREKLGFPVPVKAWLQMDNFYQQIRSLFQEEFVNEFFDQDAIVQMLDNVHTGVTDERRKVWTIYTFLIWYKVYFINNGEKPEVVSA